jgi:hypothetical protein
LGVGVFVVLLLVDGLLELADLGLHVDAGFTLVFGLHVDAGFTLVFGLHVDGLLATGFTLVFGLHVDGLLATGFTLVFGLHVDVLLVSGFVVDGLQDVLSVLEVPVLVGVGTTTFPVGLDNSAIYDSGV